MFNAGVFRQLFEVIRGLVALFGHDDHETLEGAVLAYLLINLLDQTGQGFGGLAGEYADHRACSVTSSITKRRSFVRAGDIVHLKWVDRFTDFQTRLHGV